MTPPIVPALIPPSAYGSLFQTQLSYVTFGGTSPLLLLHADPRRVYVAFFAGGGFGSTVWCRPGPIPNGFPVPVAGNLPLDYKFHDCPSVVMGEWYGWGTLGATVEMIECLFVG